MSNDLKRQLAAPGLVIAPGIYDALTAMLAERAGFTALYLSGAAIAYTKFGRPDIGLVDMTEVASTLANIADRVDVPVIVDGDTGFGNALNVQRTVRQFERAGAGAIQLEDQTMPKRCGHLKGKTLVSTGEMTGKIKAALDARVSDDCLIVARTDAIAVEGLDAALDRARAYAEAGADMLFVEALRTEEDMRRACRELGPLAPMMANMVEGGQTPIRSRDELADIGYSLAIFPGGTVRAAARFLGGYFESLQKTGTTDAYRDRMYEFDELQALVGTQNMLELGKKYDG
jgi:2-methylisocitrate lyase-like PEP mutase family enzyme